MKAAARGPATVAAYVAAQPIATRRVLAKVRAAIRRALPEAEEAISYRIPTYRVAGRAVIYFAGWARHYSLYPVGPRVVAKLGDLLAPYQVAKGTVRFPLDAPVPVRLIERIARLRKKDVDPAAARSSSK